MPSSEAILTGATAIANEWRAVAIAWHVVLGVVLAAVFCGWRPSIRVAAYILATPFPFVSAAAWVWGNPFNGTVFAVLFFVLLAFASRLPRDPVRFSRPVVAIAGALLLAFGAGYPHFLETNHWITYGYAGPLGVLPCPTLSAVIGATLVFGLLGSAAWSMTLVIAGFAYGTVGVFGLGVQLDYALLSGALALLGALTSFTWSSRSGPAASSLHSTTAASRGMP